MDTENEKQPTPTPKYGSFTMYRDWKNWYWPYEWAPTLMMIVQSLTAAGVWYFFSTFVGINQWISLVLGAAAGIAIGFLYNVFAHSMGWQKLHWIDVLLSTDILWP